MTPKKLQNKSRTKTWKIWFSTNVSKAWLLEKLKRLMKRGPIRVRGQIGRVGRLTRRVWCPRGGLLLNNPRRGQQKTYTFWTIWKNWWKILNFRKTLMTWELTWDLKKLILPILMKLETFHRIRFNIASIKCKRAKKGWAHSTNLQSFQIPIHWHMLSNILRMICKNRNI